MESKDSLTREGLKKDLEDYIDTKVDVMKLKLIEKAGSAAGGIVTGVLSAFIGNYIILFLSVAAAFGLSKLLQSYALGFMCMGLIYGVFLLFLLLLKDKLITFPIIKVLLDKFYYSKPVEEQ
jgi:hypothetical protein